jgi:hypothetical protein
VFCLLTALLIAEIFDIVSGSGTGVKAPTNQSAPIPNRYNRYFFVFYSENVTQQLLDTIFNKIIDFDNYCGGENILLKIYNGKNVELVQSRFNTLVNYTKGIVKL